jgi:hypothetical protein
MSTIPLHLQPEDVLECYTKTAEEHQKKIVLTHENDCDERPSLYMLAYRASTHESIGTTAASMVFGGELRLPCVLLFGASAGKDQPTAQFVSEFVERMYDIHH